MKRKIIFCIFALTALTLSGCTQKSNQSTENSTPNSTTNSTTPSTDTTQSATQAPSGTAQNSGTETTTISEDEAKQIALDRVSGAATQDIVKFKSDYDNGMLRYEGKIHYNQQEYEFEIDAYSGEIVEWDVEPLHNGNA